MTEREPTNGTNLDIYGNDVVPWSRPFALLKAQPAEPDMPCFLSTVRPNGVLHTVGIGALWYDGDFYLASSLGTRQARNVAANPACTIASRLVGIDMVFEGEAHPITDCALLGAIARTYREGRWPSQVEGDALTALYSAQAPNLHPSTSFSFGFTPPSKSLHPNHMARQHGSLIVKRAYSGN